VPSVAGRSGANLVAFVALIDSMRDATRGLTLREIIGHVIQASNLADHYRSEREGADRLENLDELINAAEAFVTQEGFGRDAVALPVDETALPADTIIVPDAETGEIVSPLAAFLTHAALEAGDNQARNGQDAMQLMTVHSAKGLEFDAVFITGLEEGLFPHENSMSDGDGLEEERRLMYVAITRARQRLYLSFAQTRLLHGQTRYNVKSRFFDELPEAALKWITPRNAGFGSGYAREYQQAWDRGAGLKSVVGMGRVAEAMRPAARASEAATSRHGLRTGQAVFHTKFGEGVILTLEGGGADARAQVSFGRHGSKWLALGVAKLTPID
jgi:DNA helicase II / ATP-dependent DNA helicase PcrA